MLRAMQQILIASIFIALTILGVVDAQASQKAPLTLRDYIDLKCDRNCAPVQSVLTAVLEVSTTLNLDPILLLAVIRVESAFDTKAKNGTSVGLTQVSTRWHPEKFAGRNVYDVKSNISAGAQVLKECLDKKKNVDKALRCYNGGGDPSYVPKVTAARKELNALPVLF